MWETVLKMLGRRQTIRTALMEEPAFHAPPIEAAADEIPVAPPQLKVVGGSHNLQVGQAGGDVTSQVSHHNHSHSHTHVTIIQATAQQPANEPHARMPSPAEHSAALHRMDLLRNRLAVLNYMNREFETRMVIHLKSEQLFRLNRYLDVVLRDPRNVKSKRSKTAPKA